MKSKSTSSFQRNFIFNACMNQSGVVPDSPQKDAKFKLKTKNKMHSSKTLGKPVSINDLNFNKKDKFPNKTQLCTPFQQILKPPNVQNKLGNYSLTNSAHHIQNPRLSCNDLVQSQHSRRSRYEGNKIKIFSNDNSKGSIKIFEERGKSASRDSHGTSASREKRGIQVTKTLLKKISGMYSNDDFGRKSQLGSSRSSQYQKSQQKLEQDSFYNQTGFMMTTWDSQRTTEQYQLSREYESVNNHTRNQGFGLATYGGVNILNNSYQSSRGVKDLSRHNTNYSNHEIADYSMGQDGYNQVYNHTHEHLMKSAKNLVSPYKQQPQQKIVYGNQKGVALPVQYQQRPSYHMTIKQPDTKKKELTSSVSKSKLFTKNSQSKVFSSNHILPSHPQQGPRPSPQKNSLVFSRSKQLQKMGTNVINKGALFETAHQILSEEVSSIKQPLNLVQTNKSISGEELTNLIYGNKQNNLKQMDRIEENEREKYLVKYKNKTLEDLSVKQSLIEGYDNYYQ